MNKYVKYGLIVGAGLFALKLLDDSKKLSAVLAAHAATPKPTTTIGGGQVPVPFVKESEPGTGPTNSESGLANDNPSTAYGPGYMG